MIRHAARAVPWTRVVVAAVLVLALMELVRRWPWSMWPLEGAAVGVLAGAAAWCLDEPSAAVVDAAPRGLAWRTVARGPAVLLLLAVWGTAVWWAGDSLFGQRWDVGLHGVVAVAAAMAWTSWRRAAGAARPGSILAVGVLPLATAWALVRPLEGTLPVFPYGPGAGAGWETSRAGWLVVGIGAVVLLVATLADGRWWPVSRRAATWGVPPLPPTGDRGGQRSPILPQ